MGQIPLDVLSSLWRLLPEVISSTPFLPSIPPKEILGLLNIEATTPRLAPMWFPELQDQHPLLLPLPASPPPHCWSITIQAIFCFYLFI